MGGVEVWYAIPSASPERCRETLPRWRERGYKVAVLQNVEKAEIPADVTVWADEYPGWAASINRLCASIVPRNAPIVVSGGDDMLPDPRHTAQELAVQFMEHFADSPGGTFGVMQPHGDGFLGARHYCGSPWLGRAWIERMYRGLGPMFPGYRHNWADNELFWLAKGLGALWERPDLSQVHDHFTRNGRAKPEYWSNAVERHDRDDVQLFIARMWQRFPGHEPRGATGKVFDAGVMAREGTGMAEAYWMTRYGHALLAETSEKRFRAAVERCRAAGYGRVALFGAGTHTRALGAALMEPGVPIVAIIDDQPALQGRTLWNYPIVSREGAMGMRLDAVILSSNTLEDELWEACAGLRGAGVEVMRLYERGEVSKK